MGNRSSATWWKAGAALLAAGMIGGAAWAAPPMTAGHMAVGDTTYPDSGIQRIGGGFTEPGDESTRCVVVDTTTGFGYFGTYTSPGSIFKYDLASNTRVASITLDWDDSQVDDGAIDEANGFAYFVTYSQPARVVKVDLATFTLAEVLTLNSDELFGTAALIDPANQVLYVGLGTLQGRVAKVDLTTFTRTDGLLLDPNDQLLSCGAIDLTNQKAYFTGAGTFGPVVRVDLASFTRESSGNTNTSGARAMALDAARGKLYLGRDTTATILQLDLPTFPGMSANIGLGVGNTRVTAFAIDAANTFLYATAGNSTTGRLARIDLATTGVGSDAVLNFNEKFLNTIALNGSTAFLAEGDPGTMIRVNTSTMSRIDSTLLNQPHDGFRDAHFDAANDRVIFSTRLGSQGIVAWSNASTLVQEGALIFSAPDQTVLSSEIDPVSGHLYLTTEQGFTTTTLRRYNLANFSPAGSLVLPLTDDSPRHLLANPARGELYYTAFDSPWRLARVNMATMTHAGELSFNVGESGLVGGVVDAAGDFAYYFANTPDPRVIRVDLDTYSRMDHVDLGVDGTASDIVYDPVRNALYCLRIGVPVTVTKIDLSTFTVEAMISLTTTQSNTGNFLFDAEAGMLFVIQSPQQEYQYVDVEDFVQRPGGMSLGGPENLLWTGAVNAQQSQAHAAGDSSRNAKISYGQSNWLKASRMTMVESGDLDEVRFHSHAADGSLVLSIYDDSEPRTLLWTSGPLANSADGAEFVAPIAAGSPAALTLPAGDYWLAWQCSANERVPSRTSATAGDGFRMSQPFNTTPAAIDAADIDLTDEVWTMYVAYSVMSSVTDWSVLD